MGQINVHNVASEFLKYMKEERKHVLGYSNVFGGKINIVKINFENGKISKESLAKELLDAFQREGTWSGGYHPDEVAKMNKIIERASW